MVGSARDVVVSRFAAALDQAGNGAGSLLEITGEAGIGKTRMLAQLRDHAAAAGAQWWAHLTTRPERELGWGAVCALVTQLPADARGLDEPSVRHTRRALLGDDPHVSVESHLVAVALSRLIIANARRESPLVLAIDDSQWLDEASAGALTFATRVLDGCACVMVSVRRSNEPARWCAAGDSATASTLTLPGLDRYELAAVFADQLSWHPSREVLDDIHRRTQGNPLYALELGRLARAGGELHAAAPPASLPQALERRIRALPAECRELLAVAGLVSTPSLGLLGTFAGSDVATTIEAAEDAGIVHVAGSGPSALVSFAHPLFSTAAVASVSSARRRAIHEHLTDTLTDPEARAHHLRASGAPDRHGDAGVIFEAAGDAARRRGAVASAARHYAASVAATPADDPSGRSRRQLLHGDAELDAGWYDESLVTLGGVATDDIELTLQARLLSVFAIVRTRGTAAGLAELRSMLPSTSGSALRNAVYEWMVALARLEGAAGSLEIATCWYDECARSDAAEAELLTAGVTLAAALALIGEPVDVDHQLDVTRADGVLGRQQHLLQLLWFTGDLRGIDIAARTADRDAAEGSPTGEFLARHIHASLLIIAGDIAAAERELRECVLLTPDALEGHATLGFVLATLGQADSARRVFDAMPDIGPLTPPTSAAQVAIRRAMAALALGESDSVDRLVDADAMFAQLGVRAPRVIPYRRDLVEALVAAGRLDEAVDAAARLRDDADRCKLEAARADADAAAAVVAAASANDAEAAELFELAGKRQERQGARYELARTLLAAGKAARRSRRRNDARRLLREAEQHFTAMGATVWAQRCRDEAARLGGRAASPTTLTATEVAVADAVAAGLSNPEIAATMFVSRRTVEANLSRVYRKLGVRSRTELVRWMHERDAGT